MEFDPNLKFKKLISVSVKSELSYEEFVGKVWKAAAGQTDNLAQPGEGEIWIDYSDILRTRHLSCVVSQEDGAYCLTFSSGSRTSRVADVLAVALALGLYWTLSKILVPSPSGLIVAAAIVDLSLLLALVLYCGKRFGKKESAAILDMID